MFCRLIPFNFLLLLFCLFSFVPGVLPVACAEPADFATVLTAAEQGNAEAQANLGNMYEAGRGVTRDFQQALAWYSKAAEQGHPKAQINLAVMYYEGRGVPQNYALSYVWSSLAAVSGDIKAVHNRDLAAAKLTPQVLAQAQAQAASLQETITQKGAQAIVAAPPTPVQNKGPSSSGSGFIITSEGHIITCAHVVEKAQAIKVKQGELIMDAAIVRLDQDTDLALLKATTTQPLSALAFAPGQGATLGQDVFTFGYPDPVLQGMKVKLTKGSVSSLAGAQDNPLYYQISVPIQPGNSGGALLDNNGNVVGIVTSQIRENMALKFSGSLPQNINYAVKASYILALIDSLPEVTKMLPPPSAQSRPFEEVAAATQLSVVQVLVYE
jgi:S1-C subfamily serine protease